MADPAEQAAHSDLVERVPENRRYYPMVFINGEPRIAGSAEYYEVLYAVRSELDDQKS
jgi:disulfide oxidoreductase YuzD